MRKITITFGITAFAMLVGLAACGDDTSETGSGGTGNTGNSATTASANGGSGATGSANGGAGGGTGATGGTGGSAPAGGYCGKSCAAVEDCCAGNPMCPGDTYPNNPTCEGGTCGPPQCASDMECTFNGALPDYKCFSIDFGAGTIKSCAESCMTDADCTAGTTCIGTADEGKYCTSDTSSGGCKMDADCAGFGKCDTASGGCFCDADADCTAMGVDKCVK